MGQKFSDNARSLLQGSIAPGATSLTVESAKADRFPIADTSSWGTPSDWFKATLIDVAGNREVVYVGTRALGSAVFGNILRAQEGTTALTFTAGSAVLLTFTAVDVANMARTPAIQDQEMIAVSTGGTGTAYTGAVVPAITSYAGKKRLRMTWNATSGDNPTLQLNGLGSPPNLVKRQIDGSYTNIQAGDIPAGFQGDVNAISPTQWEAEIPRPQATRGLKMKTLTANITLTEADNGCYFRHTDGTAWVVTLPSTLSEGFTCSIGNKGGAGCSVALTGGATLTNQSDGATGGRTVSSRGEITLIQEVAGGTFSCRGSGIT